MATGFPAATGDVLTSAMFNGLTAFTVGTANTVDYTAVLNDQYQVLEIMNKATAIAFKIPTDASVAFAVGTAITVLNIGVGTCTISAVTPGTTTVLSSGAVAASPTIAQYKSAVCIKTAANTWYVVGGIA
jgi:hypothetical protein